MSIRTILLSAATLAGVLACSPAREETPAPEAAEAPAPAETASMPGALTADEQAAGWRVLFNGSDFTGWKIYGAGPVGEGWSAANGEITLVTRGAGDIMTEEAFGPFELSLEWKISPNGNSGIIYLVNEVPEAKATYQTGPEMQVLDDAGHPDGQIPSHRAGALYDFAEPTVAAAKPVGEWNEARVVYTGDRIEHWLNGQMVAESSYGDDAWREKVAATKFKSMPLFGTFPSGHIALQDHGDPVWYRNIKIRPL